MRITNGITFLNPQSHDESSAGKSFPLSVSVCEREKLKLWTKNTLCELVMTQTELKEILWLRDIYFFTKHYLLWHPNFAFRGVNLPRLMEMKTAACVPALERNRFEKWKRKPDRKWMQAFQIDSLSRCNLYLRPGGNEVVGDNLSRGEAPGWRSGTGLASERCYCFINLLHLAKPSLVDT